MKRRYRRILNNARPYLFLLSGVGIAAMIFIIAAAIYQVIKWNF